MSLIRYLLSIFFFITIITCYDSNYTNLTNTDTIFQSKSEFVDRATILTNETFDEFIKSNELVMVEFHSPSCGHCKKLAPVYSEMASEFEKDPVLKLGKISEKAYRNFTRKFQITHHPSFLIFHKGVIIDEYLGEREKDAMMEYLSKIRRLVTSYVESIENLEEIKTTFHASMIYFGTNDEDIKTFWDSNSTVMRAICKNNDVIEKTNAKQRSIVIFKEYDDKRSDYIIEDNLNKEHFDKWSLENSKEYVKEMRYINFLKVFIFDKPAIILYDNFNDTEKSYEHEKILYEISKKVQEKIEDEAIEFDIRKLMKKTIFAKVNVKGNDVYEKTLIMKEKVTETMIPTIRAYQNKKKEMYIFKGKFNYEQVAEFVSKFFDGRLKIEEEDRKDKLRKEQQERLKKQREEIEARRKAEEAKRKTKEEEKDEDL